MEKDGWVNLSLINSGPPRDCKQEWKGKSQLCMWTNTVHEVTSPQAFLKDYGCRTRVRTTWFNPLEPLITMFQRSIFLMLFDSFRVNGWTWDWSCCPWFWYTRNCSWTGRTQPGKFIVCGDSHTAYPRSLWCHCLWIGTSEVEHVWLPRLFGKSNQKKMLLNSSEPHKGIYSKDANPSSDMRYVCCLWSICRRVSGRSNDAWTMEETRTIGNMSIDLDPWGSWTRWDDLWLPPGTWMCADDFETAGVYCATRWGWRRLFMTK